MPLPPNITEMNDEALLDLIFQMLILVERHEAREFFHVNGQRWRNPHRDDNWSHLYT